MSKTKLPIVIDSKSFHFVIVGPIGYDDGVIIKSTKAENELIGYANIIYTEKYNHNVLDFSGNGYAHSRSKSFMHSNSQNINVDQREFNILLAWKGDYNDQLTLLLNTISYDIIE